MLKLLVLFLFLPVLAEAGPSTVNEQYSKSALLAFQKDIGSEIPSGVIPLVGFSSIQENGIDGVDIFLANSPEDITAFRYLCDKLSTGVECTFHSMQARCFYYAQAGFFTPSELSAGLSQILKKEVSAVENFKIWQFKKSIFSELDVLVNGTVEKRYYACQQEDTDEGLKVRCEATSSPVGNAP